MKKQESNKVVVLTGGIGVYKTTLLHTLKKRLGENKSLVFSEEFEKMPGVLDTIKETYKIVEENLEELKELLNTDETKIKTYKEAVEEIRENLPKLGETEKVLEGLRLLKETAAKFVETQIKILSGYAFNRDVKIREKSKQPKTYFLDRWLLDAQGFIAAYTEMGMIPNAFGLVLMDIASILRSVTEPDNLENILLVHLYFKDDSKQMETIRKRGRKGEETIDIEFNRKVNEKIEEVCLKSGLKMISIAVDDLSKGDLYYELLDNEDFYKLFNYDIEEGRKKF